MLSAICVPCKKRGWARLVTLRCVQSPAVTHNATWTYTWSFKHEWTLIRSMQSFSGLLAATIHANLKIRSSYGAPHHFRNMPLQGRTTFLREGYICFRTFTNENIAIPISASLAGRFSFALSPWHTRKISLMVTPRAALNGYFRNLHEEKSPWGENWENAREVK